MNLVRWQNRLACLRGKNHQGLNNISFLQNRWSQWWRLGLQFLVTLLAIALLWNFNPDHVFAGISDDNYDGNIFVLYAGNGSLVPPKLNLKQSLELGKPAVLVFYIDDSKDCKKYAYSLNRLQAKYTPAISIIPINADSLQPSTPEAKYYRQLVPQTVVIDRQGKVILDRMGSDVIEEVESALEKVLQP